jgi:hypothetical protein
VQSGAAARQREIRETLAVRNAGEYHARNHTDSEKRSDGTEQASKKARSGLDAHSRVVGAVLSSIYGIEIDCPAASRVSIMETFALRTDLPYHGPVHGHGGHNVLAIVLVSGNGHPPDEETPTVRDT